MIDIHNHLIPSFDDGSKSIEESLKIIELASSEGITDIICTAHYDKLGHFHSTFTDTEDQFKTLIAASKNRSVHLHLGNELYYDDEFINLILDRKAHVLANSHYVLFEFSRTFFPEMSTNAIYDCVINGYTPILAHPERYTFIQKDPNILINLINEGCLMQINSSSLLGKHGHACKKCANLLLKKGFAHFVASDTHRFTDYSMLKKAYDNVSHKYGNQLAEQLFVEHPKSILLDQKIHVNVPNKIIKENIIDRILGL